jgi:hypothetical protein
VNRVVYSVSVCLMLFMVLQLCGLSFLRCVALSNIFILLGMKRPAWRYDIAVIRSGRYFCDVAVGVWCCCLVFVTCSDSNIVFKCFLLYVINI